MILTEVFTRFYKSFNYDYLRKNSDSTTRFPWEYIEDFWYPYVRVRIAEDITTIVGANESGKSHLLSAIKKGITGEDINPEDFCRYSRFNSVSLGKTRFPDFGFLWKNLTKDEKEILMQAGKLTSFPATDKFYFFRENKNKVRIFIPDGKGVRELILDAEGINTITGMLPRPFTIDAEIALPSSVPITFLASAIEDSVELLTRQNRLDLMKAVLKHRSSFQSVQTVNNAAQALSSDLSQYFGDRYSGLSSKEKSKLQAEFRLACALVCTVALIDPEKLTELARAIRAGLDGHVSGLIRNINKNLEKALNFPRWWVQDRAFSLRTDAREHELVFTIRDRTEQDYSFEERSSGLKYFLSYYVQYLAHKPASSNGEILLMDEPDAYLSSQAQQDLLKIFYAFAHPEDDGKKAVQVIYVTHSPFLIDRNHSDRIRVLEKGSGEEGTRVVRNVSRNHYEPLRSALGAFVAETTFIGNCNLMVEGASDQILIAGAATFLKSRGATDLQTLDLNSLTIVPCGSASHVPYLVFLARGRDYEQPAVIVLLDSDQAGNDAKSKLLKSAPLKSAKLKPEFVLQIGELQWPDGKCPSGLLKAVEIEDLVPIEICVDAVKKYFEEFPSEHGAFSANFTKELVLPNLTEGRSIFHALESACKAIDERLHLDKIGFARAVVEITYERRTDTTHELIAFEKSMRTLFSQLTKMRREALRDMSQENVTEKIGRVRKGFFQDHPSSSRREEAMLFFEEMYRSLNEEPASKAVRTALELIVQKYKLDEDVIKKVEGFASFKEDLEKINYQELIAADKRGKGKILYDEIVQHDREINPVPNTPSSESVVQHTGNQ